MKVAEGTLGGSEPRALPFIVVSIAHGSRAQVNAYFFGAQHKKYKQQLFESPLTRASKYHTWAQMFSLRVVMSDCD
jgi:hypothetical protein